MTRPPSYKDGESKAFVYLLRSLKTLKFYIGWTANIKRRLYQHNQGETMSTKPYRPWELIGYETYTDNQEAKQREKALKRNSRMQYFFKKRLLAAKEVVRVKKIILAICGIILISGNFAMAQNNGIDKSTETQKMEKYKVKESAKPIDIQNIAVLDYGKIKIKREKKTKTGKKTIEFYNAKGKLIKQLKLDRWDKPRMSQNKKLIGIQKYGFKEQELEIFNENGEKIKTHKNIVPYEKINISNNGAFIVSGFRITQHKPYSGAIAFYNKEGKILKKVNFTEMQHNLSIPYNDSYFAFLIDFPSQGTILLFYTNTGKILWKYSLGILNSFPYKNFFISDNRLHIKSALQGRKHTWIFNKDGLVEKKKGW